MKTIALILLLFAAEAWADEIRLPIKLITPPADGIQYPDQTACEAAQTRMQPAPFCKTIDCRLATDGKVYLVIRQSKSLAECEEDRDEMMVRTNEQARAHECKYGLMTGGDKAACLAMAQQNSWPCKMTCVWQKYPYGGDAWFWYLKRK